MHLISRKRALHFLLEKPSGKLFIQKKLRERERDLTDATTYDVPSNENNKSNKIKIKYLTAGGFHLRDLCFCEKSCVAVVGSI